MNCIVASDLTASVIVHALVVVVLLTVCGMGSWRSYSTSPLVFLNIMLPVMMASWTVLGFGHNSGRVAVFAPATAYFWAQTAPTFWSEEKNSWKSSYSTPGWWGSISIALLLIVLPSLWLRMRGWRIKSFWNLKDLPNPWTAARMIVLLLYAVITSILSVVVLVVLAQVVEAYNGELEVWAAIALGALSASMLAAFSPLLLFSKPFGKDTMLSGHLSMPLNSGLLTPSPFQFRISDWLKVVVLVSLALSIETAWASYGPSLQLSDKIRISQGMLAACAFVFLAGLARAFLLAAAILVVQVLVSLCTGRFWLIFFTVDQLTQALIGVTLLRAAGFRLVRERQESKP